MTQLPVWTPFICCSVIFCSIFDRSGTLYSSQIALISLHLGWCSIKVCNDQCFCFMFFQCSFNACGDIFMSLVQNPRIRLCLFRRRLDSLLQQKSAKDTSRYPFPTSNNFTARCSAAVPALSALRAIPRIRFHLTFKAIDIWPKRCDPVASNASCTNFCSSSCIVGDAISFFSCCLIPCHFVCHFVC